MIIYTGKELTRSEETKLKKFAESIIVKDASSPERLLDQTSLFLHRVEQKLPKEKRRMLEQLHSAEEVFNQKKILIVDDDVRNVFALTSVLEAHGMEVLYAENGTDGIELLRSNPEVDLVLMDIMMPGMDGYATMRAIRAEETFKNLPKDLQDAILKAGKEAGAYGREVESSEDTAKLDALEKAGKLKRVPFADRDAMKKLVDPVMAAYAKEIGAEKIFAAINDMK